MVIHPSIGFSHTHCRDSQYFGWMTIAQRNHVLTMAHIGYIGISDHRPTFHAPGLTHLDHRLVWHLAGKLKSLPDHRGEKFMDRGRLVTPPEVDGLWWFNLETINMNLQKIYGSKTRCMVRNDVQAESQKILVGVGRGYRGQDGQGICIYYHIYIHTR